MQDKKYIPIIAAALVILLAVALAYFLFTQRKEQGETMGEIGRSALEALSVPSNEVAATEEELQATLKSLQMTGSGGAGDNELNQALQSLSTPAE